jgi:hypothetical protein
MRVAVFVCLAALAASFAASAQPIPTLGPLDASGRVTYFVNDGEPGSTYRPGDRELATWALKAWERVTEGRVHFEPAPQAQALVQVHWVAGGGGQYGEMRPIRVGDKRGAAVYIMPDTNALGRDDCVSHLRPRARTRARPRSHRRLSRHHVFLRLRR